MTSVSRWQRSILPAAVLLGALWLAACSHEADDWRHAQAADTATAYQQFMHQYPSSAHTTEANTRIGQLAEDEAWQLATSQDSKEGYQQFVSRYPDGKWAQEARVRIENFSLVPPSTDSPAAIMANMASKAVARPAIDAAPPPAPIAKPASNTSVPLPPAATAARASNGAQDKAAASPAHGPEIASPGAGGKAAPGFAVQLGAYSAKVKAEAAWAVAQKRFKTDLAGGHVVIVPGKSGTVTVYRLRVAQPNEAAARNLCAKLTAERQACVLARP
jgi:cell division septation protein DedD